MNVLSSNAALLIASFASLSLFSLLVVMQRPLRSYAGGGRMRRGLPAFLLLVSISLIAGCGSDAPVGMSRATSIGFGSSAGSGGVSLAVGATAHLQVIASYPNGSTKDVSSLSTFTTSNASVATVDTTGNITGVATGSATITGTYQLSTTSNAGVAAVNTAGNITGAATGSARIAEPYQLLTTSVVVTISPNAPTLKSIAITPAAVSLHQGIAQQLQVTATLSNSTTQDVTSTATYASSVSSVATVSSTGVVTAISVGSTTITASYQGQTATVNVMVTAATATSLALSSASGNSLAAGTSLQLIATAMLTNSTTATVTSTATYTSSNPSVATIDATGKVTAVATGAATITASYQGQTATVNVTVTAATATSLALSSAAGNSLAAGTNLQLMATATFTDLTTATVTSTATYTSSNPSVATVDATGKVTAVATGAATITASYQGKTATAAITVTAATVQSIALVASELQFAQGLTAQLQATATLTNSTTQDVTSLASYTSSNPAVATVNTGGIVTGVSVGSTVITATYQGKTATSNVTITAATITSLTLSTSGSNLAKGATAQLQATLTYTDGTTTDVTSSATYSSSAPLVATSDSNGLVSALTVGSTIITATDQGQSATVNIAVTPAVIANIFITPGAIQLANGTSKQLQALATFTDGTLTDVTSTATWDAPSSASISGSGLLTATSAGTATITATQSGIVGSLSLTVTASTLQSVVLTPINVIVAANATLQLSGQGIFSDGSSQNITAQSSFATSDPSIATVSSSGLISGVSLGTVTITVTTNATLGSKTGSIPVVVTSPTQQSVAVSPATASVASGYHQQMSALATFSNGSSQDTTQSTTWASSDTTVALVDANGVVTALNPGTVTITATTPSVTAGTATITVTSATLQALTIMPNDLSMYVGESLPVTVTGTFSDGTTQDVTASAVLAVSEGLGAVIALPSSTTPFLTTTTMGTGTLTATLNGTTTAATLTVSPSQTTAISVESNLELGVGQLALLEVQAQYADGTSHLLRTNLTFDSSSPTVVTVDGLGNMTGKQAGSSSFVTATYHNPTGSSFAAALSAVVSNSTLQAISLVEGSAIPVVGVPAQFYAVGTSSDGNQLDISQQVSYTSSNPSVATINNLGVMTPVGVGATQISATLNGVTGTVNVNIGSAVVQSIAVNAPSNIALGETTHLTAIATFSDSSQQDISSLVTWSSDNSAFGVVDAAGNATGVAAGTFNAVASWNGVTGQATLPAVASTAVLQAITVTPVNRILTNSAFGLLATTTQYSAIGHYSDGSTRDLTTTVQWSSSYGALTLFSPGGYMQFTLTELNNLVGFGQNVVTVVATYGGISGSTNFFINSL